MFDFGDFEQSISCPICHGRKREEEKDGGRMLKIQKNSIGFKVNSKASSSVCSKSEIILKICPFFLIDNRPKSHKNQANPNYVLHTSTSQRDQMDGGTTCRLPKPTDGPDGKD